MQEENRKQPAEKALELAAKYICNQLAGLCPQVQEGHRCPTTCDLDTLPWQCWIDYFLVEAEVRSGKEEKEELVAKAA